MKLPFVLAPRRTPVKVLIGSEESGKIEIERRGYITGGEKAFMGQALSNDTSMNSVLTLTRKISKETGIDLETAYQYLIAAITGESAKVKSKKVYDEVCEKYADELTEVLQAMADVNQREVILKATCMVMYRIESSATINDVMELHEDIIHGLAKFYDEEERGYNPIDEESVAEAEEDTFEAAQKK